MRRVILPILALVVLTVTIILPGIQQDPGTETIPDKIADASRIEAYMQQQVDIGPRIPGSNGSLAFAEWIFDKVDQYPDYSIKNHTFVYNDVELRNFLITASDSMPKYLIGAHYDTRARADKETNTTLQEYPVPGANDAASGVAGILELMHYIPAELAPDVGYILFDGEDQGANGMKNATDHSWNWIVGSQRFVDDMTTEEKSAIESFILFDMIADDELVLWQEGYSDDTLISEFWSIGDALGYSAIFSDSSNGYITDDHRPFVQAGIPSIDLIDLNYPEHHLTTDDMDHVDPSNVGKVVDVTLSWLEQKFNQEFIPTSSQPNSTPTSNSNDTTSSPTSSQELSSPSSSDSNPSPLQFQVIIVAIIFPNLIMYFRRRKNNPLW